MSLPRDFAAGVYLSEAQNPIPPPYTHCIPDTILIHTVKEGRRVETERRAEGQQFKKLSRKYQHDFYDHLPQSLFTDQLFQVTTFCFGVCIVNNSMG
jgi:hypothetical protein